jgi:hypothetical protein
MSDSKKKCTCGNCDEKPEGFEKSKQIFDDIMSMMEAKNYPPDFDSFMSLCVLLGVNFRAIVRANKFDHLFLTKIVLEQLGIDLKVSLFPEKNTDKTSN